MKKKEIVWEIAIVDFGHRTLSPYVIWPNPLKNNLVFDNGHRNTTCCDYCYEL